MGPGRGSGAWAVEEASTGKGGGSGTGEGGAEGLGAGARGVARAVMEGVPATVGGGGEPGC